MLHLGWMFLWLLILLENYFLFIYRKYTFLFKVYFHEFSPTPLAVEWVFRLTFSPSSPSSSSPSPSHFQLFVSLRYRKLRFSNWFDFPGNSSSSSSSFSFSFYTPLTFQMEHGFCVTMQSCCHKTMSQARIELTLLGTPHQHAAISATADSHWPDGKFGPTIETLAARPLASGDTTPSIPFSWIKGPDLSICMHNDSAWSCYVILPYVSPCLFQTQETQIQINLDQETCDESALSFDVIGW